MFEVGNRVILNVNGVSALMSIDAMNGALFGEGTVTRIGGILADDVFVVFDKDPDHCHQCDPDWLNHL